MMADSFTVTDDVVIVGGGLAGLYCALKMAPRPVSLITASALDDTATTAAAQDGIAAEVFGGDISEQYIADTMAAGEGIADERIVRLIARDGPGRLEDLPGYGVSRNGGSDDLSGGSIMAALARAVRATPSIRVIEHYSVEDLVMEGSRVAGLLAIAEGIGVGPAEIRLSARAVVLATGGIGALFSTTTNSSQARGQGVAIAARSGALIADAEFVQFISAGDAAPAAHFHMGGVLTDASGRTSTDGLWACGEVASTGAHGANRLGSNALLEGIVFAARVAEDIRSIYPGPQPMAPPVAVSDAEGPGLFFESAAITRLRQTMSDHVGAVRDHKGLVEALTEIAELEREGGPSYGYRNMITTARLVTAAALMRTESRGAHVRSDFPEADPAQARRSVFTLRTAEAQARSAIMSDTEAYA